MKSPKYWKIRGYYLRHLLNPIKWWHFALGFVVAKYITFHYCEQVVYRSIQCSDCFQAGKCKDCSCSLPDKGMVPEESCSLQNWGPMVGPDDWAEFKQQMGINFYINYNLTNDTEGETGFNDSEA